MIGQVLAWPELLGKGWSAELNVANELGGKQQIVCCGMGGSAIGAGLIGDYLGSNLTVPYQVVRDYTLPGFVGADTLVVCISFSGGTEETLACYEAARAAGATVLAAATGGELIERAQRDGVAHIVIDHQSQPRAALPVVFGLLLKLFVQLGYAPAQAKAIADATAALQAAVKTAQTDDNPAVSLAERLAGTIPFIYGAGFLSEAARRFKGQISENGKQTAAFEVLPEQNHNALVGYEFPPNLSQVTRFVLLRSTFEHPRHARRFAITKDLLGKRGLSVEEIQGAGAEPLSHLLTIVFWTDLTSVQLAYRNGADPTPVDVIIELKDRLAQKQEG